MSGSARSRLVNLVVRTLAVGPARRAGLWLVRHRYARRWPSLLAPALDRVIGVQQPDMEQRKQSVDELVELFFDLCADGDIDLFVEAGAKEASASKRAAGVAGIARVVAFEANPYTFARFAPSLDDSRVEYLHLALTDTEETVTFLVRRHDDGSPIPDGQGSLLRRPGHAPGYEHVSVDGVALDSFFAPADVGRVAMWVDVEGVVDRVVGGAGQLLRSCDFVIVEVESRAAWEGQEWLHTEVVHALGDAGLSPVARDVQSRFQFNILFARATLADDERLRSRLERWRTGR